uniref:Uncharacterized protein n=1 Tax=Setaria viridis TaxID=4556 RepID=A0A4U6TX59_SETVI|nr:hypothetical protein SEVIR_8G238850v2 [Setaria viridis]
MTTGRVYLWQWWREVPELGEAVAAGEVGRSWRQGLGLAAAEALGLSPEPREVMGGLGTGPACSSISVLMRELPRSWDCSHRRRG